MGHSIGMARVGVLGGHGFEGGSGGYVTGISRGHIIGGRVIGSHDGRHFASHHYDHMHNWGHDDFYNYFRYYPDYGYCSQHVSGSDPPVGCYGPYGGRT